MEISVLAVLKALVLACLLYFGWVEDISVIDPPTHCCIPLNGGP
jgi:hypothetical protein